LNFNLGARKKHHKKSSKIKNERNDKTLEIRGVETIEEFFRPEYIQQIMSQTEEASDTSEFKKPKPKFGETHDTKAAIRGMGFPNMKHLDPLVTGSPV